MSIATTVLVLLAAGLFFYAWRRGDGSHRQGIILGWQTTKRTLPLLIVAFALVGYVNVLAPQSLIEQWLGPNSGLTGLILATITGMLLPGGPYVVFPLIAVLYQAGAGVGPAVALISSWAMLGLLSVAFELPFMGWRFSALRWGLGLIFPVLAGGAAQLIFGG
ncbi:MAG TPA: hypothetical protein G4N96_07005 [Chloroflexi bacterium]|nr:hypothetical protein [Chloroflexota bacterium]